MTTRAKLFAPLLCACAFAGGAAAETKYNPYTNKWESAGRDLSLLHI